MNIRHQVAFEDTQGTSNVARHTPIEELKELPPIHALKEAVNSENVKVSPARSACAETEVTVQIKYKQILWKAKQDLREEFEERIRVLEQEKAEKKAVELSNKISTAAGIRLVEDWAVEKMRKIQGLSSSTPRNETIAGFMEHYTVDNFPMSTLRDLVNSSPRLLANDLLHLSIERKDEAEEVWRMLKELLSAEEIAKYKVLHEFAMGSCVVHYK